MMLVHHVRKLALPLHRRVRRRKLDMFFESLRPSPSDSLLDVGGATGMQGEFAGLYTFFDRITTLNLAPEAASGTKHFVQGDACDMPFPDRAYDWVFSNAVIEHVGGWPRQQKMAQEVQRVARKGYFITTPNWSFPVDPHCYLPCYHQLPGNLRERLAATLLHRYVQFEPYWMLSRRDLKKLFPGASLSALAAYSCLVAWARLDAPPVFS
jgi:ubiquinone/menaquinone biosynthesis C-methylase UbiE